MPCQGDNSRDTRDVNIRDFPLRLQAWRRTMARTYEKTHPWLSFGLDTKYFSHRLWMALGEDCAHVDNKLPEALRAQLISLSIWVITTAHREAETAKAHRG